MIEGVSTRTVELVERKVRHDRRVAPSGHQRGGETLVAHVQDGVVIRHHDQGDIDVDLRETRGDPRGRRPDVQRAL